MITTFAALAFVTALVDDPAEASPAPPGPVEDTAPAEPSTPSPKPPAMYDAIPPPDAGWPTGIPGAVGSATGCGLAGGLPLVATGVLGLVGLVYLVAAYTICPCFIIQSVLFLSGAGVAGVAAGPLAGGGACVGAGVAGLFTGRFWQGLLGAIPGVLVGLTGSAVLLSILAVVSDEGKAITGIDGTTATALAGGLLLVGVVLVALAGPVGIGGATVADLALAPAAADPSPATPSPRPATSSLRGARASLAPAVIRY